VKPEAEATAAGSEEAAEAGSVEVVSADLAVAAVVGAAGWVVVSLKSHTVETP
jgi:hypothetical protein